MFHEIPDAVAITRQNGIFRQCKVFHHKQRIFVRHGAGFIWIHGDDTSAPTVRLDEIELPWGKPKFNELGYMVLPDYKESK